MGDLVNRTKATLRTNSPAILSGTGIGGVLVTAYLAAKAGSKSAKQLDAFVENSSFRNKAHIVWQNYVPTGISAALTIGCIVGGARVSNKRAAAAYSLLTLSEKAFEEYSAKVVEQIGVKKEEKIRDEIAQDRVRENPPVMVVGSGSVLCFDAHSGRYFNSDMETLRRACNSINAQLLSEDRATVTDFYYLVGLHPTSYSSEAGWHSPKLLELRFSTVMSEDNRPCISFEFNYVGKV